MEVRSFFFLPVENSGNFYLEINEMLIHSLSLIHYIYITCTLSTGVYMLVY